MSVAKIERVAVTDWAPAGDGVIGVDFETFYTGKYSVSEMGVYAYVHDRRFNAYLVSVTDGRQCCVCHPSVFPWASIAGREWVSHNRDFDRAVWEKIQTADHRLQTTDLGDLFTTKSTKNTKGTSTADGVEAVPPGLGPSQWYCTAALCAYLQLPRDLAGAVREVFGVEISKAVRKKSKGKDARQGSLNLCGEADELNDYAAGDSEWCLALWNELEGQWPAHERRLFELTSAMGRNGLHVDWSGVEANRMELAALVQSMSAELPWSPSLSIPKFQEACSAVGVVPPKSTAVGDGEFMDWLKRNNGSITATWVRHMQRIRSANRTAKVLGSMEARRMGGERRQTADCRLQTEDRGEGKTFTTKSAETAKKSAADRMAFELKYFGATTGRWSGGGGLNLQNFNRKEAEGVDLRGSITAPPGKLLAVVDYSQIESRVLLFLAGDTATLDLFRANPEADAYEIHARATMGFDEGEPLKDYCERTGSGVRQLAKARVLGLGFGCGWEKFIEVAKTMAGLDLSESESKKVVKEFRTSNPKIVELWRRLNDACAACDGGTYALPLPCTHHNPALGRYLFYRDVSASKRGIECTICGERVYVYGGLLAENWTQAAARDVMASAWLRCADAGYMPVLTVHDELVFEVDRDRGAEELREIQRIMEAPVAWAPGLPLKTDGKLMAVYGK